MGADRTAQIREVLMTETRNGASTVLPFRSRRPLSVAAIATVSVVVVGGTAAAWVTVSRPDEATSRRRHPKARPAS